MKRYSEIPWTDTAVDLEYEVWRNHLDLAVNEVRSHDFDANRLCNICLHSTALGDPAVVGEDIAAVHTSASRVLLVPISANAALSWIGKPPWSFHMPGGGKCINDRLTVRDIRQLYKDGIGIGVRFKLGSAADRARRRFDSFIESGEEDISPELEAVLVGQFKIERFPEQQLVGAYRPSYDPSKIREGGKTNGGGRKKSLGIRSVASVNGQIYWDDDIVAKRIHRGV